MVSKSLFSMQMDTNYIKLTISIKTWQNLLNSDFFDKKKFSFKMEDRNFGWCSSEAIFFGFYLYFDKQSIAFGMTARKSLVAKPSQQKQWFNMKWNQKSHFIRTPTEFINFYSSRRNVKYAIREFFSIKETKPKRISIRTIHSVKQISSKPSRGFYGHMQWKLVDWINIIIITLCDVISLKNSDSLSVDICRTYLASNLALYLAVLSLCIDLLLFVSS